MPKINKKREFNYHFSEDSEEERNFFKKEFTILLASLFPKGKKLKWKSIIELIFSITILAIILVLIFVYFYKW